VILIFLKRIVKEVTMQTSTGGHFFTGPFGLVLYSASL